MWHSRPPRDPPPFMANALLNFHFDYWHPSLRETKSLNPIWTGGWGWGETPPYRKKLTGKVPNYFCSS